MNLSISLWKKYGIVLNSVNIVYVKKKYTIKSLSLNIMQIESKFS